MTLHTAPPRTASDGFVLVHRTLIDTGQRLALALRLSGDDRDLPGLVEIWNFYRAGLYLQVKGGRLSTGTIILYKAQITWR